MDKAVRRGKTGGITLDLLAIDRANREGTLSAADRDVIEAMLPGMIARLTAGQIGRDQARREGAVARG